MDADSGGGGSQSYHSLHTSRADAMKPDDLSGPQPQPQPLTATAPLTGGSDASVPDYRVIPLPKPLPSQATRPADAAAAAAFCSNVVITSKYTAWNFLPLFLVESFRKLANAYFLLVSVLQMVPTITNTGGLPSNLPVLLFILAVDGVLAVIEDRRRHRADNEANSAQCHVVTASFTGGPEAVAAARLQPTPTGDDPAVAHVLALEGVVRCENPNKVIGRFDGTLTLSAQSARPPKHAHRHHHHAPPSDSSSATVQMPVSIKNVLLRGCQLRNTDYIFGLVLNTGPDTKIMQSSVAARPKWSSINETVNRMIIGLFVFLCALCAAAATAHLVWMYRNKSDAEYLGANRSYATQWFVSFGSYFLLMYQLIPVSLYVTISMVMFIQAIFMTWDLDVYYAELDIGRAALRRKGVVVPDEVSPGPGARAAKVPYVNFEDARLLHALKKDDRGGNSSSAEADFFLHLSLCQTVIPEVVDGSAEVRFSASSPDEQALVSGAKFFGLSFESRGLGVARIRVFNKGLMRNKSAESELQDADVLKDTMRHLEAFGDDGLRTLTIARRRVDEKEYLFPTPDAIYAHLADANASNSGGNSGTRQAVVIDGECLELTLEDPRAVFESFVIFLFVVFAFNEDESNAGSAPMVQYGLLSFTCVVLVANLKLALLQMSWSVYGAALWFLGVLSYLPATVIVSSALVSLAPSDYGSFQNTLYQETYWLVVPLCCVVCLLRHFAWTAIQRRFYPLPWQIVQEYFVLGNGALPVAHRDVEAGGAPPMLAGIQDGDDAANYLSAASPSATQRDPERVSSSQHPKRKQRISSSSGFAYSYDPQTAMAESYISTHSLASATSALSDAEHRGRSSREDSRSSDYSDSGSTNVSVTDGAQTSRSTTGLFV
ncbi:hypothetical protein PybrP1_011737 [[Pythium] brassicae (nom. inval.)]|nr:hypothetical protein PybrP1_011737 [[Pythium] brassicae (nom. inval.)]